MSGHSKWHQIRRSKGIVDAKRGAIFTKHARAITVAAQHGGGDPEMNPTLRLAIDRAKADNMPKDNIERAVRRGSGDEKGAAMLEEVTYEVIGPDGSMGLVLATTDNRNRTAADVRHVVEKHGGKVAAPGAVAFMFERTGYISLMEAEQPLAAEEIELLAIDLGALDVQRAAGVIEIYTPPADLMKARAALEERGLKIGETKPFMKPKAVVRITDVEAARRITTFFDLLQEHDDIAEVFSNVDLAEEVIAALDG